jgi:hypothetical protein
MASRKGLGDVSHRNTGFPQGEGLHSRRRVAILEKLQADERTSAE